jgi:hypothetical protein
MSVPSWAIHCISIALLSVGCGRAERSAPGEPNPEDGPSVPSESALLGAWRWQYLTAGAVQYSSLLTFEAPGIVRAHFHSMTSFTEPASNVDAEGTFELGANGTVRYTWQGEGTRVESEHSLTFVEPSSRTAKHPCCRLSTRYWTHRGYLAMNRARTRFRREAMQRAVAESGAVTSFLRTGVELTFPAAPATLLDGGDCSLDVAIQIEGTEGTREFTTALDCVAQTDGSGIGVIFFPGFDVTSSGASLLDQPSSARERWQALYTERSDANTWPESLRKALAQAFEPYIAFDLEHPDVLFHYIAMYSLEVEGYYRRLP